jgi:hypothetical protein
MGFQNGPASVRIAARGDAFIMRPLCILSDERADDTISLIKRQIPVD